MYRIQYNSIELYTYILYVCISWWNINDHARVPRPRGLEEAAAGEAEADARLCSQGRCSRGSAEAGENGEENTRKDGGNKP